MKPLNTQERSKLFWQFFFIVITLCFLPIGIIFCAYYEAPREIDREDQEKLAKYTEFEHNQRVLVKQLSDIDNSILALNNGSNVNVSLAEANISKAIANLSTMSTDTGSIIKTMSKAFSDYYTDADRLLKSSADNKTVNANLLKAQADLKECADYKKQQDLMNAVNHK